MQKVGPTGRNVHGLFCERLANVSANDNGMRTAAQSHDHPGQIGKCRFGIIKVLLALWVLFPYFLNL